MSKKRLIWLLICCAVLGTTAIAAVFYSWFAQPVRRFHANGFESIANGMTEHEVVNLMKGPPGMYARRRVAPIWGAPSQRHGEERRWEGEHYIIYVWFEQGLVVDKARRPATYEEESTFKKLLRQIGL